MLNPRLLSTELPRRGRIAAISGAVQRRPIVLVLGMHRSGTSLCSNILSALGVDMADQIPGPGNTSPAPDNPRGHWERWEIVEFHDRILGLFNRDYLGRFHDFSLPVAWWADPRVVRIRHEIAAFLEQRMGEEYFGFKDPRTVRLMPMWHQIFNELKLAPRIVLCLRNPAQVARSLRARDGLDPANGEYRWLVHMIDFFRYTGSFDCCTVEYEEWFDNPAANIEILQKFLDLPWQQSEPDIALLLSDIVDPTLRHDDPGPREAGQPLVRTLYKLASGAGADGAREQIAYIVSQFISFQQLQKPLLQAFEGVAATAAKYPALEHEAAALRALVGERDAVVAAADAKAASVEERLAEALTEIEKQSTQIAELAGKDDGRAGIEEGATALPARVDQRDAAIAAADAEAAAVEGRLANALAEIEQLQAQINELARKHDGHVEIERAADGLKTTLAERDMALAERSRRADELFKGLEVAQAALLRAEQEVQERRAAETVREGEITALQEALAQAKQSEHERAAAAMALEAELRVLREKLAQAEREVQQREAAAAAVQGEIAALRGSLARAQREAARRAAASEALQAEVLGLRQTLAQTETEAKDRAAAAAALRAEMPGLRQRLAETEGEAQDRAAAVAALRSEIATLQQTLTAARQVGRAVVAAFRIETAAPTKPDRPGGWRRGVMRFFGVQPSF
jgi:Sulfotransferase family/Fez1